MSVEKMLEAESEAAEARRHEPLPDDAIGTRRRNDATVLSVRLTKAQYAELAERAARRNVPTSTFARTLLLDALRNDPGADVEGAVETALRNVLRPEFLRAHAG